MDPPEQVCLRAQDRFPNADLEIIDLIAGAILAAWLKSELPPSSWQILGANNSISSSNSSHLIWEGSFLPKMDPPEQLCLRAQGRFPNADLEIIKLLAGAILAARLKSEFLP